MTARLITSADADGRVTTLARVDPSNGPPARTVTIPAGHDLVTGHIVAVRGNRLRIATDDGHVEVEVGDGHHFSAGMDVRVHGVVHAPPAWLTEVTRDGCASSAPALAYRPDDGANNRTLADLAEALR